LNKDKGGDIHELRILQANETKEKSEKEKEINLKGQIQLFSKLYLP
jgi:hypothetical protein